MTPAAPALVALALASSTHAPLFPLESVPPDTTALRHPAVVLLDDSGAPVSKSGDAVSPMRTCGLCHDTEYIATHNYHAAAGAGEPGGAHTWDSGRGLWGQWNPITYRQPDNAADWIRTFGSRHVGGGPAAEDVELNCFVCHLPSPDQAARVHALEEGAFRWAATATLAGTGLVHSEGERWTWDRSRFDDAGHPAATAFDITAPTSRHCGACHGLVQRGDDPVEPRYGVDEWSTETTGQIFSPQRIYLSAMNVAGKDTLTRPWDVHAERLLECTSCHGSPNNPAHAPANAGWADDERPRHLAFEARRQDIAQYLRRPDHDFVKGHSVQGSVADNLDGTMRRCEDCHDAASTHTWLPYTDRHLARLMCESCHIPRVYAPARTTTDWTVVTPAGGPRTEYRGVRGAPGDPTELIETWRPVLLPRREADGRLRLGPYQLSASWFWVAGDPPRPVKQRDLERAFFDGDQYHADIVAAFDSNGDGTVAPRELMIDSDARRDAVRARLEAVGVESPHIAAELQPMGLHHGVAAGTWATRDCSTCHAARSVLSETVELSKVAPGGVTPVLVADANVSLPGTLEIAAGGDVRFTPDVTAEGFYVLGHDRSGAGDAVGVALIVAVLLGAVIHGGLRYRCARERNGGR